MKHEGYCSEEHRSAFEQRVIDRLSSWKHRRVEPCSETAEQPLICAELEQAPSMAAELQPA
jgi:hypothetical protein